MFIDLPESVEVKRAGDATPPSEPQPGGADPVEKPTPEILQGGEPPEVRLRAQNRVAEARPQSACTAAKDAAAIS